MGGFQDYIIGLRLPVVLAVVLAAADLRRYLAA